MSISPLILKYINKPIVINNKLLKDTTITDKKTIRPKFLIENINSNFENYIYDIIKNYG